MPVRSTNPSNRAIAHSLIEGDKFIGRGRVVSSKLVSISQSPVNITKWRIVVRLISNEKDLVVFLDDIKGDKDTFDAGDMGDVLKSDGKYNFIPDKSSGDETQEVKRGMKTRGRFVSRDGKVKSDDIRFVSDRI